MTAEETKFLLFDQPVMTAGIVYPLIHYLIDQRRIVEQMVVYTRKFDDCNVAVQRLSLEAVTTCARLCWEVVRVHPNRARPRTRSSPRKCIVWVIDL